MEIYEKFFKGKNITLIFRCQAGNPYLESQSSVITLYMLEATIIFS
jgi:hypothetical protein